MAAYDGVPSIRLEGDKSRALALVPDAKALLYRVQSFLKTAGVSTFSGSQNVDSDGYIYVLSSNGQNIIHISVDVVSVDQTEPELPVPGEGSTYPSFYSGIVIDGYLETRTGSGGSYLVCTGFSPTPTCVAIHEELSMGRQSSKRLGIHPFFDELRNQGNGPNYSQYTMLRPSMYSGIMASVVQVIFGLARIDDKTLIDPRNPLASKVYRQSVKARGIKVQYDYKYHRTHGITRASDGRLWLVEISQSRGVIAMPLPLFPKSSTSAYIERAIGRGDTSMETALNELHGLPTGEGFPASSETINARIAAGTLLRLMEPSGLSNFYRNQPYSSNIGWAFNGTGTEAHNTGYRYGDDGIQRGVWYLINIQIGATRTTREPGEPIASGSASLRLQSEGYLFSRGSRRGKYLPIKFYDPLLHSLRSHDGSPSSFIYVADEPRCDTVMFVCFVNDELKTVRFFRNPTTAAINEVDDPRYPGECMYAGSWTITAISGLRGFATMMYTNDYDDRQALDPLVQITQIDSVDIGYNPPRFSDFITSPEVALVSRTKVFKRTTVVDTRKGEFIGGVVVVPQYCRETYYYATGHSFTLGRSGSTSVAYDTLGDPNIGYTWRNFPRIGPPPWPDGIGCAIENCGGNRNPGQGIGPRKVVCTDFGAYPCSDFADSGSWLSQCQVVDSFATTPTPVRPSTYTAWDLGDDSEAHLHIVSRGYNGPIDLEISYASFETQWLVPSPDPETGGIQQLKAVYSTLGLDCIIFDTDLTYGAIETRGYVVEPVTNDYPCFIGVNQP